jgi:hypothetical protein
VKADWQVLAAERLATIGIVVQVGAIVPENQLHDPSPSVGAQERPDVWPSLRPEQEPMVQQLRLVAVSVE